MIYQEPNSLNTLITRAQYAINNYKSKIAGDHNWDKYGKSAGYRRNKEMVDIASAAICFWDGKSKGTKHTIDLCKEKEILCKVVRYE